MNATRREITIQNPCDEILVAVVILGRSYAVNVPPHSDRRYWLYEVGELSQLEPAT